MKSKRFKIKTSCPQCGCSAVSHLTGEQIKSHFGDVPNVEMTCSECTAKYQTTMEEVCPQWVQECRTSKS